LTDYCTANQVKERMLIDSTDTAYDVAIASAITEASESLVDVLLKPYTTVPLTSPDAIIGYITADFAASIFKRRMVPDEVKMRGTLSPDGLNDVDASGWFALGWSKLEKYIKSYYTQAQAVGVTLHNPDIILNLVSKGLLLPVEGRKLINDSTNAVIAQMEKLERTETLTTTKTATNTITDTIHKNITDVIGKTVTDTETNTITNTKIDNLAENLESDITKNLSLTEASVKAHTERKYITASQNTFIFTKGKQGVNEYEVTVPEEDED
jgi:hypothetical protein